MSGDAATTLTARGRAIRLMATALAGLLLVTGTVWGGDDHFPFGPFKMYAGAADPDASTIDTRVEATDVHGGTVLLTEHNTGIRRAEIEGQLRRFREEPELLRVAAEAYARQNPEAALLREVRIVVRWHEVRDYRPTGEWEEEVAAVWRP